MSSPEFPETPLNLPNVWKFTKFWEICGEISAGNRGGKGIRVRLLRCGFGDHLATSKRPRFLQREFGDLLATSKRPPFFWRPFRDLKTTPVLAPGISRPFRDLFATFSRPQNDPPFSARGDSRTPLAKNGGSPTLFFAGFFEHTGPPSGRLGQKYGSTIGPARAKIHVHHRAGSGKNTGPPSGRLGQKHGSTLGPARAFSGSDPSARPGEGRGRSVDFSGLPRPHFPLPGLPLRGSVLRSTLWSRCACACGCLVFHQ